MDNDSTNGSIIIVYTLFSILLPSWDLAFFSFISPPILFSLFRGIFHRVLLSTSLLDRIHRSTFVHQKPLFSFFRPRHLCVCLPKICSRLPRRDVDARYSGYRVTSSSQCSEINSSSGKMLLLGLFLSSTSFNLHLSLSSSSWPAVIRTQFDDYCVTDKHQSGKLVGQFKFAPLGNVTLVTRWINERGEFLARSLA